MIIPAGLIPKAFATNATLTLRDLFVDDPVVVATQAITLTLPTPTRDLSRYGRAKILAANGAVTLSCTGGFVGGGNSKNITTLCQVEIECVPDSATGLSYKWSVIGEAANLAELTADQLAGIQSGTLSALNPVVGTGDLPVKATGAETNTGTNDTKFLTPKAIEDSDYAKTAAIPVKASSAEIIAEVDDAKFVTAAGLAASNYALKSEIPDASAGYDYTRTGLTGGTANDLDGIAYANLSEGHTARVNVSGQVYTYRWNAASAAAESSPDTIRADDDAGGNGRWILDTLDGNMYEFGTAANTACQGNDARIPTTAEKAALVNYECTALTGGGAGALDTLAVATLTDLEIARVVASNVEYMYQFNAAAVDAENSPTLIRPDDFGAAGVWYLMTVPGQVVPYGTTANTATAGNDARIPTTAQKGALFDYSATSLTGGGAGALDAIDGTALVDGDTAIVVVGNAPGVLYVYVLDDDDGGAESSPDKVQPDANAGTKMWVLATSNGSMGDYGTTAATACAGNDGRLPTTAQKTALFDYSATSLTGGGAGALDLIDGTDLVDGDTALVIVGNNPGVAYFYVLDADNAGAESSPDIIAPDANGGDKRWVLSTLNGSQGDYGTTAVTACAGNDGRLPTAAEKTALASLVGAAAFAAFSPTAVFSGGAAVTVSAEVYRQKTIYDWCEWLIDIALSDGGGATTLTVDFPAALVPTDVNMKVPVKAQVSVGGGAFANVLGTLDCEAADAADRQLVVATGTLTDDQAARIIISGGHQITPA